MRRYYDLFVALSMLSASLTTNAAPCAGFTDVDASDPFCRNIEWIRNRGVTLGCGASNYCPDQPVSRNQMAAFMNRLGAALTPRQLWIDSNWGPVDLDISPVVCQTVSYSVIGYPRRAFVDLAFAGYAPTSIEIAADLVITTDAGNSWTPMTAVSSRGSIPAAQWGNIANLANADLSPGQVVNFGVRLNRVSGSADLSQSRCNLRVSIESRDGTASPY